MAVRPARPAYTWNLKKHCLHAPEDGVVPVLRLCPVQSKESSSCLSCVIWKLIMRCASHASSVALATLACIRTAPRLLWCTPASNPIGEACITVVRRRGGAGQSRAAVALARAALSVDLAAPSLLAHSPARLPIRKAVGTVVRISWGRRLRWLTAKVMVTAAPQLLGSRPRLIQAHSAVGIDWTRGRGRLRCRWRRCRRRRRRWRRWLRRSSGGRLRGGTPHTGSGAAILLLLQ